MRLESIIVTIADEQETIHLHRRLTVITGFSRIGRTDLADQLIDGIGDAMAPASAALPWNILAPLLRFGLEDLESPPDTDTHHGASWVRLDERVRQMSVLLPRGTALVLEDPFRALADFDLIAALVSLRDAAARHQLLYLTEEPQLIGWARHLVAEDEAAVVHLGGSSRRAGRMHGAPGPSSGARVNARRSGDRRSAALGTLPRRGPAPGNGE